MKRFLLPAIWTALILAFSIGPGVKMPDSLWSPDKLAHFAAYGILEVLVLRAWQNNERLNLFISIVTTILVSVYGAFLEFLQLWFFPSRFFEYWDMVANASGAITGFLAFYFFTKT